MNLHNFRVAIVGRPNVGKSTLFNRLVGKRIAIVDSVAGVTRDRKEAPFNLDRIKATLTDTAGFEYDSRGEITQKMMQQTKIAIDECDLLLFVIDGIAGLTPIDREFASLIRKSNKDVLLVVNKCENSGKTDQTLYDSLALGFGNPIITSAEHSQGIGYIFDEINDFIDLKFPPHNTEISEDQNTREEILQVAIVGRPNVGKSTLINGLLGEERVITGEVAGTTRDAISIPYEYKDRKIKLVDTAGFRRRSHIDDHLEKLSVEESFRAIFFAQVVVAVIDADRPFEKQDLTIINYAIKEGRAIVLAVNKWDKVEDKSAFTEEIYHQVGRLLTEIKDVPIVFISALYGKKLDNLLDEVLRVFDLWNTQLSTSKLNDWLPKAIERHAIPLGSHRKRPRIKYMNQSKTRPPTFCLFGNMLGDIDQSYVRYLTNSLREEFDLPAVPIRFTMRSNKNPYV